MCQCQPERDGHSGMTSGVCRKSERREVGTTGKTLRSIDWYEVVWWPGNMDDNDDD